MERTDIVNAFRTAIISNENLSRSLFSKGEIPENISDLVLSISSLDFADLLINVEEVLGVEFAEGCMTATNISIGELIERIEKIV